MGLTHTRFANPVGLDDPDNHSSALDLARIARRVLRGAAQRAAERRAAAVRLQNLKLDQRLEQLLAFWGKGE
jgi:D-alanyl-D-alanine carboxypeptidase